MNHLINKSNTMIKRIAYSSVALFAVGLTMLTGCEKVNSGTAAGTSNVEIRMTDAPGDFDAINLSVKEIILISDDEPYTFSATTSIFNILDYRIGSSNPDILVASGEMPVGKITDIRLVLNETGNTIVVDGVSQDLKTPAAQSSGWKVKLEESPELLEGATYSLVLDFDAAKSIVQTGNGKYLLKPVVRGLSKATSGLVSGIVLPLEAHPEILVIAGTDTVGTVADPLTGKFAVGGLATGDYSVKFVPVVGFRDSTITNVSVNIGQNNNLGTIVLGQ